MLRIIYGIMVCCGAGLTIYGMWNWALYGGDDVNRLVRRCRRQRFEANAKIDWHVANIRAARQPGTVHNPVDPSPQRKVQRFGSEFPRCLP